MKNKLIFIFLILIVIKPLYAQKTLIEKKIFADKQYILMPINSDGKKYDLDFEADNFSTYFDIRLASHEDSIDYWVFMDISRFKNKTVTLKADKLTEIETGFNLIHLSNQIKSETPIYKEKLHQQFHFSSKRGWNNDPNGFFY